jgi:uncharacterized protein YjiS (DUF1127 family)
MSTRCDFDGCDISGRSMAAVAGAHGILGTKGFFVQILDALWTWQERAAARRALARLDDRMLSDIGVDRATADDEINKPFWRA